MQIGFQSIFEDTADFSEMSAVPLKVDSAIQKAFLEVDEFGSEAAAATGKERLGNSIVSLKYTKIKAVQLWYFSRANDDEKIVRDDG